MGDRKFQGFVDGGQEDDFLRRMKIGDVVDERPVAVENKAAFRGQSELLGHGVVQDCGEFRRESVVSMTSRAVSFDNIPPVAVRTWFDVRPGGYGP